jgi:hypothetical protein
MSGVMHDFECKAHGLFEKRVKSGEVPRCPKGCSKAFVSLVHLNPPGFVGDRTRSADRLIREAADMQGLSDISTSPSRPGGSVAERNRMKNQRGPQGREYDARMAAHTGNLGGGVKLNMQQFLGSFPKENPLTDGVGMGHKYNKDEWKKDDKTGQVRHVGAAGPLSLVPTGSTGVSVDRVRE